MSTLDPIAISIIGKAIDFLFAQASKTLDKSRAKKEVEAEQQTNKKQKEEILQSLIGEINAQEVEHCMAQIERYTRNKQKLEIQVATYGTEIDAPLKTVNQLRDIDTELDKWITKLKSLIEEASNKEIKI
jgi:hypothetical protein